MPIYTVDLSCRSSRFDYTPLFTALRNANAQPFMDSRWLIDVGQDLANVTSALLGHCASVDGLFITELAPETRWSGTALSDEVKAWLTARKAAKVPPAVAQPKRRAPRRKAA